MAKPTWSTTAPSSGAGNGTVDVGGSAHTGRSPRSGTLTYKAAGAAEVPQSLTQSARPEFVTITDVSVPKAGGNVTITGKSNTTKLSFALGLGDLEIALPPTYLAGGASTANSTVIAGDPGASAAFDFSLTVTAPSNTTISEKTRTITVTAAGGQTASSLITQAAGDPTLTVTPPSITLDADGTAVTVTVTSNTNWTVE